MKIPSEDWNYFVRLFTELEEIYQASSGSFLEGLPMLKGMMERFIPKFLLLNEEINLTAIRDPSEVLWKHFFDSFLVLKLRPFGVLLDWGSGGGFPGVPLLFFRSFIQHTTEPVILLDSKEKKVRAVERLLREVGFSAGEFVHGRGEDFIRERKVDGVLMRAVAPPEKILVWLDSRVPNWFFFTTPEQQEAWLQLEPKIVRKGLKLQQILQDSLPFALGKRNILHFAR